MPGRPLLILATRNRGKVAEIREILAGLPVTIGSLIDRPAIPEIPEEGMTLLDNALVKARTAQAATGLPCLSDDSGLEVDALGGAPGVRSARFAGDEATVADNNRKLLADLAGTPEAGRTARFVCVAAFVAGDCEVVTRGVCEGSIATSPSGEDGFGYDPLFIPRGGGKTFAMIPPAEKNSVSHRARAFRKILPLLSRYFHILP